MLLGAPAVAADATEGLAINGRALARKTASGRTSDEVVFSTSTSLKLRGSNDCGAKLLIDEEDLTTVFLGWGAQAVAAANKLNSTVNLIFVYCSSKPYK